MAMLLPVIRQNNRKYNAKSTKIDNDNSSDDGDDYDESEEP